MKCDRCENEATVQELTIRNNVRIERHLCEQCARQLGLSSQTTMPLSELLTKYVLATGQGVSSHAPKQAPPTECPSCRMSWSEFRQVDRLGCADCYSVFEAQLGPLLERWHEGGVRHTGKSPARAASRSAAAQDQASCAAERTQRILMLRKQLDQAVLAEQYERAAALRDEIRRLGESDAGAQVG